MSKRWISAFFVAALSANVTSAFAASLPNHRTDADCHGPKEATGIIRTEF